MNIKQIEAQVAAIKPDPGFLNIQKVDSNIIVDLKYATPDNFTGHKIYDFTTAIARAGTARKLGIAAKILYERGYRIKVWDAFRPNSAQKRMYQIYPHDEWVAAPNPNYSHEKGVTFDLTITDLAGKELPMQSGFDDFTGKALRNYPRTGQQERNYQILDNAMQLAGFHGYESEWWDYQDNDADRYQPAQANPNDY
ncbi:M15 family metallopeptidase [Lactobacillus sp. ESL0684]|uniref:M15 family metallopeptidase n=1 Tax=unclassified Lactobacillus TaxID=2620435 RepID=UPI0023F6E9D5|nr:MULTISPECIES: M15 family metallopeptidase [unclassified Lactobacillus]WEV39708.1 M15 family metallopeptidase [Lactobacillus sp. ESL0681]WEV43757.1 M15 family metallopeptidase [Lactobacillus sp. ESL0684]